MSYRSLNENEVENYIKEKGFFGENEKLQVKEIGDGNLNLVFKVIGDSGKSYILKQALPYVKIVGSDWPLQLNRNRLEAEAMKMQGELAPGLVPEIYYIDNELALFIMEDLSTLEVMRKGTLQMKKYPNFSEHISTFLANTIFYTSDFYLNPLEKKEMVRRFINPDLCKITEDLIFTDPYYNSPRNKINPELISYLENKFWKRQYLWNEASKLKYIFMTKAESLLHGDLHTGSIFVSKNDTKVFDSEFSFFGPSAFDPGLLIGNLLINYVSWEGKEYSKEKVEDYREYLLITIGDIYKKFTDKFSKLWGEKTNDISFKDNNFLDHYFSEFFEDMMGYAAAAMIRRMHGLAHNIDVDEIEDLKERSKVQIIILELATQLMMNRERFKVIEDVISYVKSIIF